MGHVTSASEIAKFLNSALVGEDFVISGVAPLSQATDGALVFSKNKAFEIGPTVQCLVLCPPDFETGGMACSSIAVANPRLAFAKVVNRFFAHKSASGIHRSTIIGNNCSIHSSVSIGAHCVIGDNVCIGENSVINNCVVLFNNTVIGSGCYIRSGSVIGEDGFGFDFEEDGTPVRIPHLGNVVIGNDVEIGSNSSIARGTMGATMIGDSVKIDDQVFIAHNCVIGRNSVIIACAEVSGSVRIGENCWIGPNSSIIQKVVIGDCVTIGIGAVVTGDVASHKKIMGLEGLELRPLLRFKKRVAFGD